MTETKRRVRTLLLSAVTVFTVLVFLAVSALSLLLYREGQGYVDLTKEGLYTLSDAMTDVLKDVDEEIAVTFFADPDRLLSDSGMRPAYLTAKAIEKEKPNVRVVTGDLATDPAMAEPYKENPAAEIDATTVAVSYGKKFRTATVDAFYSTSNGERVGYLGEMRLASMILSVVRVEAPAVYFTTGHGERYYDENNASHSDNASLSSFRDLLLDLGLLVKTLDLDSEEIPTDCVLLVMNGPSRDYDGYAAETLDGRSPTEKIDRYLYRNGSVLYLRDPDVSVDALPVLSELLSDWGITLSDRTVKETAESADRDAVHAVYADKKTSPIALSIYESIAGLTTPPRTVLPSATAITVSAGVFGEETLGDGSSRTVVPFLFSGEKTRLYDDNGDLVSDTGSYPIAAIALTAAFDGDYNTHNGYLAVFGTSEVIANAYVGTSAYGNADILTAALRVLTRTDTFAPSELGTGTNPNSPNYGGKLFSDDTAVTETTFLYVDADGRETFLTQKPLDKGYTYVTTLHPLTGEAAVLWTVLFALLPLAASLAGAVVLLRRRHL